MTQRHPQPGEPPTLRGDVENPPALAGAGHQPSLRGVRTSGAYRWGTSTCWPVMVIVAALLTLLVWVERIAVPLHR